MYNLSQVPIDSPCIVQEVSEDGAGIKLMEMGLTPGTEVTRVGQAPSGDPISVLVDNSFILGLRKEEAELVTVYFPT
jgi:Fe2+ transport system protein FeoA